MVPESMSRMGTDIRATARFQSSMTAEFRLAGQTGRGRIADMGEEHQITDTKPK